MVISLSSSVKILFFSFSLFISLKISHVCLGTQEKETQIKMFENIFLASSFYVNQREWYQISSSRKHLIQIKFSQINKRCHLNCFQYSNVVTINYIKSFWERNGTISLSFSEEASDVFFLLLLFSSSTKHIILVKCVFR